MPTQFRFPTHRRVVAIWFKATMDLVNKVSAKKNGKQYIPVFARISVSQECSAVSDDEIYNKHIKRSLEFTAGAIDI